MVSALVMCLMFCSVVNLCPVALIQVANPWTIVFFPLDVFSYQGTALCYWVFRPRAISGSRCITRLMLHIPKWPSTFLRLVILMRMRLMLKLRVTRIFRKWLVVRIRAIVPLFVLTMTIYNTYARLLTSLFPFLLSIFVVRASILVCNIQLSLSCCWLAG